MNQPLIMGYSVYGIEHVTQYKFVRVDVWM